jgi:hypothetical protein
MEALVTFLVVCGIVWGGFITLLFVAMKKEKVKNQSE